MDVAIAAASRRRTTITCASVLIVWAAIYGTRAAFGHLSLMTNAYDLSVFDYALWSTGRGHPGYVPFLHQTLTAQHVMPTLAALLVPYQAWPSPSLLIAVQLLSFAIAGALLYLLLPRSLPSLACVALVVAFLFGRRSHSAAVSFYYIESLEPLLVFAMLLLWRAKRRAPVLAAGALALGCKEDMAVYLALFGVYLWVRHRQRIGAGVAIVCAVWLAASVWLIVPAVRQRQGLPPADPFVASIRASRSASGGSAVVPGRAASTRVAASLATVTAGTGFLCWLAPEVLAIALPGLLLVLIANPHTTAIGITGHYFFPILPWLFYAAACGAARLQVSHARALRVVSVLLLAGTVADSPLLHGAWRPADYGAARAVTRQLAVIPPDAPLLAMPNLVPHLPHRMRLETVGTADDRDSDVEYVALSAVGDLWPLDRERVRALIAHYRGDARFRQLTDGPAFIFERR